MMNYKISVAMATYNGEKYIINQLESIAKQSHLPNEVVICDDCSSDKTINRILEFQEQNPELNVKLFKNDENLGYTRNFYKAAGLCAGDIIFFSDQDDEWDSDKVEHMLKVFLKYSAGAVLCNSILIDNNSKVIGNNRARRGHHQNESVRRVTFEEMIRTFNCGGLNLAIKKEYITRYSQFIIEKGMSHDVPLGIIVSSKDEFYHLEKNLVRHRIHGDNVSKSNYDIKGRLRDTTPQIRSAKSKLKWLNGCDDIVKENVTENQYKSYQSTISFYKMSIEGLENRKPGLLLKLCFYSSRMIDKKIEVFNFLSSAMSKR